MIHIDLPDLTIDTVDSKPARGPDAMVRLSQGQYSGDEQVIDVHATQVLLIAERMGLIPARDESADRTIARLSRQLRLLFGRIQQHASDLGGISAAGHECVDEELAYASATYEIAREFVLQLDESTGTGDEVAPAAETDSYRERLAGVATQLRAMRDRYKTQAAADPTFAAGMLDMVLGLLEEGLDGDMAPSHAASHQVTPETGSTGQLFEGGPPARTGRDSS